ncbi:MAG: GatB/YqeY domain-containing protein [Patescibacteria group bacterium]
MLKEKINSDIIQALKNKEELKVSTLRLLSSAMHNREIEKKGKGGETALSDDEVLEIIRKEVKKRREAIEFYTKGGRADSAEKELAEVGFLDGYLPKGLDESEVRKIVDEAFLRVKPAGEKDFGKFMGEVMKVAKGRADSALVSKLVKEKLG